MDTRELTFVFQGGVSPETRPGLARAIARLRMLAPGAQVIVSSSLGADVKGLDADEVVLGPDTASLPGNKRNGLPNNINRQIQSTARGLARVPTRYAVKLRSDCALDHLGFLGAYEHYSADGSCDPIVACSFFTIDPKIFEQMPFHLSDWFQFGSTSALRSYWSCPLMTLSEAQHYLSQPHAPHSNFFDRNFIAQYAVEQHMAVRYARQLGYVTPAYHNDISAPVLRDFTRFMAERVIVLDPGQIGLRFDKYQWAYTSEFQNLNCITHLDWQILRDDYLQRTVTDDATGRLRSGRRFKKTLTRALFRTAQPLGPLLYNRQLRATVNRMLRVLAG